MAETVERAGEAQDLTVTELQGGDTGAKAHVSSRLLEEEVERLRKQLSELKDSKERERQSLCSQVQSERLLGRTYSETLRQRTDELEALKTQMIKLTQQLDEEVSRSDVAQRQNLQLERKLQDLASIGGSCLLEGGSASSTAAPSAGNSRRNSRTDMRSGSLSSLGEDAQHALEHKLVLEKPAEVSTKLMRVVDVWMHQKDMQQALLRGAGISDLAFVTLAQALVDCPSLQVVDLSQNYLTVDACADVCLLVTNSPKLCFLSLAENQFSLRSLGYFMTAIMERSGKLLKPLDLLDFQGNEGLVSALSVPAPEGTLKQLQTAMEGAGLLEQLPAQALEILAHVARVLWRFLHETGHPQVQNASPQTVSFQVLDQQIMRKMEHALLKILLKSPSTVGVTGAAAKQRPVTANLVFLSVAPKGSIQDGEIAQQAHQVQWQDGETVVPVERRTTYRRRDGSGSRRNRRTTSSTSLRGDAAARSVSRETMSPHRDRSRGLFCTGSDIFDDIQDSCQPAQEKRTTFFLKQITSRNGTVMASLLEKMLESTDIGARDVETGQTLLEYACHTGNLSLAKTCFRRGADLTATNQDGETALNMVTRKRCYALMEFLTTYGVGANSADANGRTALHVAAGGDDVDGICRLVEWGGDVNIRDHKKRTPLHVAAMGGNAKATMLLLEFGADLNAKDDREFTAAAHAEANNHFALMDRLVQLGGRGHGLHCKLDAARTKSTAKLSSEIQATPSLLRSTSMGRIGKMAVKGMPGPITPAAK